MTLHTTHFQQFTINIVSDSKFFRWFIKQKVSIHKGNVVVDSVEPEKKTMIWIKPEGEMLLDREE